MSENPVTTHYISYNHLGDDYSVLGIDGKTYEKQKAD